MPGEGLAGGHVHVILDPARAGGLPLAGFDRGLDLLEQFGVLLLDGEVGAGLALAEAELRELLHELEGLGPGRPADFLRLGPQPQPVHVDVRVADEVEAELLRQV